MKRYNISKDIVWMSDLGWDARITQYGQIDERELSKLDEQHAKDLTEIIENSLKEIPAKYVIIITADKGQKFANNALKSLGFKKSARVLSSHGNGEELIIWQKYTSLESNLEPEDFYAMPYNCTVGVVVQRAYEKAVNLVSAKTQLEAEECFLKAFERKPDCLQRIGKLPLWMAFVDKKYLVKKYKKPATRTAK